MIHPDSECYPGWKKFEKNCYRLSTGIKFWMDAENDCIDQNAHLVSIHSHEEMKFVQKITHNMDQVHLGATRNNFNTQTANKYSFDWTDGSKFDYENWANREPNEFRPIDRKHLDKIITKKWSGRGWTDDAYDHQHRYVCKKPMPGIIFQAS